jgi:hypothetical protein
MGRAFVSIAFSEKRAGVRRFFCTLSPDFFLSNSLINNSKSEPEGALSLPLDAAVISTLVLFTQLHDELF